MSRLTFSHKKCYNIFKTMVFFNGPSIELILVKKDRLLSALRFHKRIILENNLPWKSWNRFYRLLKNRVNDFSVSVDDVVRVLRLVFRLLTSSYCSYCPFKIIAFNYIHVFRRVVFNLRPYVYCDDLIFFLVI